jgi:tripartite-type tricarboxylate transporter receptor subunit TctC
VQSGKLKMLAVTAAARSRNFADVPTVAESGFPGFEFSTWGGLLAPARTPPAIVARLHAAAVGALRDRATAAKLTELGFDVIANRPEEFAAALTDGLRKYGELTRAASIKID